MYAGRKNENRGAVTGGRGGSGAVVAEEALWEVPGHFLPKAESSFQSGLEGSTWSRFCREGPLKGTEKPHLNPEPGCRRERGGDRVEKGKECSSGLEKRWTPRTCPLTAWENGTRTVTLVPSKCSWLTVQPGQAETLEPSEEH